MAFKNLIAFGAGELTPELWERGNLDKFRTGLTTMRNATVTKMGGLKGRAGTKYLHTTKSNAAAKFLYIQSKNYLLEFTAGNVRIYTGYDIDYDTFSGSTDVDVSLYPVMDDVENIQFTHGNRYLYIFRDTYEAIRVDLIYAITPPYISVSQLRDVVKPPSLPYTGLGTVVTYAAGTTPPAAPTYGVDYVVTYVIQGVETFYFAENQTLNKPTGTGQYNTIVAVLTKSFFLPGTPYPDELRIYQRPRNGGAYLYIGSVPNPVETATTLTFSFADYGVTPDASNQPPQYVTDFVADTKYAITTSTYAYPVTCKTGLVYQDRLIFSGTTLKNKVFGSRTGTTAMTRDFPLQADSAVSFAVGSDGGLKINRFFDGRGLMMFTTVGVYETPVELLTPDTAFAIKRGPYVADENIEPVQLGGYIVIYDKRLKAIIGLVPSGSQDGFAYDEFSIYSSHLLKGRRVVSWALQDAETQVLWIVLDDGKMLSFSFQDEQQVRSWARHDFRDGLVEEVFTMDTEDGEDVVCFCINRNGVRSVERLTRRDAEFIDYVGSDSSIVFNENILVSIASPTATIAPVTPGVWDGPLTITPAFTGFGESPGDVVRVFIDTWEYIDMEVTANTLGVLTVTPSAEYPSTMATLNSDSNTLWTVYSGELTGLSHLNGQKVSVRIDGFTHASPLNTDKDYEEYTVSGGKITLASGVTGSHISVGLPVVQDIQTLEVDTVEQSPTKLEGQIVNRLWLSYYESLFLYAGSELPTDDTITGMENQEYQVEPPDGILNTVPPLPQSERLEMIVQGDWKVKGSVALRNVDPQPIQIRAIIPDTEVIRN